MNAGDQILSEAFRQNPILGGLLASIFDGGRIICTGPQVEMLFSMVPEHVIFEKIDLQNLHTVSDFGVKDLIFVENASVDLLWNLSHKTGAQIALMTDSLKEPSLADFTFPEKDLRSALFDIGKLLQQLQSLKGQISMEGSRLNRALFLDRDGVLIEDTGYVRDPSNVRLLPGVPEALRRARELGYFLIVISNQSGIGRGTVKWAEYEKVTHRMQDLLVKEGIFLDRIMRAPFYESSQFASGLVRRSLRKPRPGMIHSVINEFRVDLENSIFVGDSAVDLMTASLAGVGSAYLMQSEKTKDELQKWIQWPLLGRTKWGQNIPQIRELSDALPKPS